MLHGLLQVWFGWVRDGGYLGVIALMAMESSILPVPSEIVIPPAAFWASQGRMSFAGVVLAGTFGSWLGSAITYWVSRWIGRAVILRWGRIVFITPDGLNRAERFVQRYEVGGVFFARLLPVIRHLISIPAGIARMSFGVFSLVTVLGRVRLVQRSDVVRRQDHGRASRPDERPGSSDAHGKAGRPVDRSARSWCCARSISW